MNAEKLVAILRQKGYHANRAGLSKSGLHMVEYLATIDKSEALVNLEMIRKDDNPSAWLLKSSLKINISCISFSLILFLN
ncbi:MAG: hypothetical protein R2759_02945 [Bacteroidales bacterium]